MMEEQRRQCLSRRTLSEDQVCSFPRRRFDGRHPLLSVTPDTYIQTPIDGFMSLESALCNLSIDQGGAFSVSGLAQDPSFLNDHIERNYLSYHTSGFYPSVNEAHDLGGAYWYPDELAPVRTGSARYRAVGPSQTIPLNPGSNGSGLTLGELRGRLVEVAKDQVGCRILESALDGFTRDQVDVVFREVIGCVGELMVDPCGNFVIQKLVEVCREEQRTRILLVITMEEFQFVNICLNVHGTRAVQKLLSNITTLDQVSLVMSSLNNVAVAMTKDVNGHHVIQYCLKHFSAEDNKYLLQEVADNCFSVSTHKSGCCVMQLCVHNAQGELKTRLVSEIIAHSLHLAEDRYGNYVVQLIVGLKEPNYTASLLNHLKGSFAALSCNKYGSNVVEKCLSESAPDQSSQIILELVTSPNASMLLRDPYGNYVIQCALSVSKGQTHQVLRELVRKNVHMLHSNIYGKKVIAWFEKRRNAIM